MITIECAFTLDAVNDTFAGLGILSRKEMGGAVGDGVELFVLHFLVMRPSSHVQSVWFVAVLF